MSVIQQPAVAPDLSEFSVAEIMDMMRETMSSDDPSDQQFCKHCRDEIARRSEGAINDDGAAK